MLGDIALFASEPRRLLRCHVAAARSRLVMVKLGIGRPRHQIAPLSQLQAVVDIVVGNGKALVQASDLGKYVGARQQAGTGDGRIVLDELVARKGPRSSEAG